MKKLTRKADVDSIELVNNPAPNKEFSVSISGFLRDGGWKLKPEKVDIDNSKFFIKITLMAVRDPNVMATQALVPFQKEIRLKVNSEGEWIIDCNSKTLKFII